MSGLIARLSTGLPDDPIGLAMLKLSVKAGSASGGSNPLSDQAVTSLLDQLVVDGVIIEGDVPALASLAQQGQLALGATDGRFSVIPLPGHFKLNGPDVDLSLDYRLSKFTALRSIDGQLVLTHPMSDRRVALCRPEDAGLVMRFNAALSPSSLAKDDHGLIQTMIHGGFILPCDQNGKTEEDLTPHLQMWSFEDLSLHMRSRRGRTFGPVGRNPRYLERYARDEFKTVLPEPKSWTPLPDIPMTGPDVYTGDLFETIRTRRSFREFTPGGPTMEQLSAFLAHSIGYRERGWRNYPNGGAIYEQHIFLAIGAVQGLEAGLYRYDPAAHALGQLNDPQNGADALLKEAGQSMGGKAPPPVLAIIASEFAQVAYKYAGIAYRLQLEHVGVMQQAMYLVAIGLGLGGCALGTANSDVLAKATGLDPIKVGSVGEFVFGVPAD